MCTSSSPISSCSQTSRASPIFSTNNKTALIRPPTLYAPAIKQPENQNKLTHEKLIQVVIENEAYLPVTKKGQI